MEQRFLAIVVTEQAQFICSNLIKVSADQRTLRLLLGGAILAPLLFSL
ncbi:hypothetical protein IKG48_03255 [Candidatus Saccharibacteria bacterium]|nr:hypothetical protein [Candidatus Saccharibacteria bacterium]